MGVNGCERERESVCGDSERECVCDVCVCAARARTKSAKSTVWIGVLLGLVPLPLRTSVKSHL